MTLDYASQQLAAVEQAIKAEFNDPDAWNGHDVLSGMEAFLDHHKEVEAERNKFREALHASAPSGHKCADCTMDSEPCPRCYSAWWARRHPNVRLIG